MEVFPMLRSGATVQYPVRRNQEPLEVNVEFWGGGSQTYRRRKAASLLWTLHYAGLAEEEVAQLLEFCDAHLDSGEFFSFRDPLTSILHERCVVEPKSVVAAAAGVNAYEFGVSIRQIEE